MASVASFGSHYHWTHKKVMFITEHQSLQDLITLNYGIYFANSIEFFFIQKRI